MDVFVECAIGIGWQQYQGPRFMVDPDKQPLLFIDVDTWGGQRLLMLAVLEKMGWGIEQSGGKWYTFSNIDASPAVNALTKPCPFSDLPLAVCTAYLEVTKEK